MHCWREWPYCSIRPTPCTALAVSDERGSTARLGVIKVRSHLAAPTPITLAESSMAHRLQAGRLQMSPWPGTVILADVLHHPAESEFRRRLRFRFVSWTVCSPYPTLNLQRLSFSSRRCTDLSQSSAAYHICSVTSCLLLSLKDIFLRTLLPVILLSCPQSDTVIYGHVNRSYLLTYLLAHCQAGRVKFETKSKRLL